MSTKSTIVRGEGFHVYAELFDPRHLYLSLEGVEFEATPRGVTVVVPIALWERIRAATAADVEQRAWDPAEDEGDTPSDEAGGPNGP